MQSVPPKTNGNLDRVACGWLAGISCGMLLVLAVPWLGGRVWTDDDLGAFHLPIRDFYSRMLRAGWAFDWMPTLFGGFYLTGEGQAGSYHPWHWLLYRFLSLRIAFGLEVLSSYPVLLAGTYFWLRRHTTTRAAAWMGAFGFAFGSFNLLHFVHVNAIGVIAHIPWQLLGIAALARGNRSAWIWAGLPLLTGSQILLGYPQYVWFSLLAELFYAACLFRRVWVPWATLACLKSAGVLLGAVQILSTWDSLGSSQRVGETTEFFVRNSLSPFDLAQVVGPFVGPTFRETGFYLGVVPMILIGLAIGTPGTPRERQVRGLCGVAAALALLLALGQSGGLFALQQLLPVVGAFRVPARFVVLVQLALAPVVAMGFDRLLGGEQIRSRTLRWLLCGGTVASLFVAGAAIWRLSERPLAHVALLAITPLLFVAGTLLVGTKSALASATVRLLVVLVLVDSIVYGLFATSIFRTGPGDEYVGPPAPPGQASFSGRIALESDTLGPSQYRYRGNQLVRLGWKQIDGYAGLPPRSALFGAGASRNGLRIAGVQWVLAKSLPAEKADLGTESVIDGWCEIPDPLPRVRFVGSVRVSRSPRRDVSVIDPANVGLVDVLPTETIAPDPTATAETILDLPGRIEVHARSQTYQLLVLNERYHRGWTAQIDGRKTRIIIAYGDFQGCVVPPGEHQIVWKFRPASLVWGRRLSAIGLLLTATLAIVASITHRRDPTSLGRLERF